MISMIVFSLAIFGFVAYGCWKMEAPWNITLICLSVPALWLALGVGSYLRYGHLAKKLEAAED